MQIARRELFDSELWRIGQVDVRNVSPLPGLEEVQSTNILVFPVAGIFAKHDRSGRVLGTPNNTVLISADHPYRLSYPAGIGDRCLTIRLTDETLSKVLRPSQIQLARRRSSTFLSASVMLMRNLLWHRFQNGQWEDLELDELTGVLVEDVLMSTVDDDDICRRQHSRQHVAVEAVKEAIASNPTHKWNLSELGKVAGISRFHLSRTFRREASMSVYDYVLRARLTTALDLLADTGIDLTAVGLEAGFSSHSHFTARFHAFFGITPVAFRQAANAATIAEMRRMVTATTK